MRKIFEVIHVYDVDGGFGDAVECRETLAVFDNEESANDFKTKYHKPKIYDRPYADLYKGSLEIEEREIFSTVPEAESDKSVQENLDWITD